jgi:hypothetical protein
MKRCTNHAKGFSPAYIVDHRFNATLMQNQLWIKGHLIPDDVIADARYLVAQGSGSNNCICLGRLAIIVSAKLHIESSAQLGGFGKSPA